MVGLSSRNALVALIALAALCLPAVAQETSGSRLIELTTPRDALFVAEGSPTVRPAEGEVLVICNVALPDFVVTSTDHIAVEVDGTQTPVTISDDSVHEEFGEIVALRFAFTLPAAKAEPNAAALRLAWGKNVAAKNKRLPTLVPDPALRDRTREATLVADAANPAGGQVASIQVVADSSAEYYFLWYLLPMAVIFTLLTIRKLNLRKADDRDASTAA